MWLYYPTVPALIASILLRRIPSLHCILTDRHIPPKLNARQIVRNHGPSPISVPLPYPTIASLKTRLPHIYYADACRCIKNVIATGHQPYYGFSYPYSRMFSRNSSASQLAWRRLLLYSGNLKHPDSR